MPESELERLDVHSFASKRTHEEVDSRVAGLVREVSSIVRWYVGVRESDRFQERCSREGAPLFSSVFALLMFRCSVCRRLS